MSNLMWIQASKFGYHYINIIYIIYSKISENFVMEKEKAIYAQQMNIMAINTEEQKKIMENFLWSDMCRWF